MNTHFQQKTRHRKCDAGFYCYSGRDQENIGTIKFSSSHFLDPRPIAVKN